MGLDFSKNDFSLFTQSPEQKQDFVYFPFVFFTVSSYLIEGTFPGSLHYVAVTYSISLLVQARPHLLSLASIKIPATSYYRQPASWFANHSSYNYTKIISFLNYVFTSVLFYYNYCFSLLFHVSPIIKLQDPEVKCSFSLMTINSIVHRMLYGVEYQLPFTSTTTARKTRYMI